MGDKVLYYGSKEVMRGSSEPYYYVDDFGRWGRILMRCQVEVEAFTHEELFSFLSIPVKLLYL